MNLKPIDDNGFLSAFTINVIFIVLIIMGLSLARYIPLKLSSGKVLPTIYIDFDYLNAAPEIVEKQVTSKLESLFETLKGIEKVKSYSGDGWGMIQLNLDEKADAQSVLLEIRTLVREIYPQLATGVSFPIITQKGGDEEEQVQLMTYSIKGNADSYILYQYLDQFIKPKLLNINGIERISIYGSTPYQWEILYYPERLNEFEISKSDIKKAISNYFSRNDLGLGLYTEEIRSDTLLLMTMLNGQDEEGESLSKIPIKKSTGRIIYLGDIAKIIHKQKKEQSFYRINGLTAINMVIYARSNANQLKLANKIKNELSHIEQKMPTGYSLMCTYDSSIFLEMETNKTLWSTIASIVLLLIFVFLVSRNFRYLFIISLSLFANLSIALLFYYLFEVEIHLYSLAGITVSLGMLLDNVIIMIEHIRHKNNKNVFLAVLAASLTTMGVLVVIFFLEKEKQINLIDFALVIMINLGVSVLIALFFIPSILQKMPLVKGKGESFFHRKRTVIRLNYFYQNIILFGIKYRAPIFVLFILVFGLPIYMLPTNLAGKTWIAKTYNQTIGNEKYRETAKPILDKSLGGTLRLFTEFVKEENHSTNIQRTSLVVRAKLPIGASIEQLNAIYIDFEHFLSQFHEIDFYQTDIYSLENSKIVIYFKKNVENTHFPFLLKGELESKALSISSADFLIHGSGTGFSNSVQNGFYNSRLILSGYNYNELQRYAQKAKDELIKNPRIPQVFLMSGESWGSNEGVNTTMDIDKMLLTNADVSLPALVSQLNSFNQQGELIYILPFKGGGYEEVNLLSNRTAESDLWEFEQLPLAFPKTLKMRDISRIYHEKASESIYRENQEYRLTLAYNFLGPQKLAERELKEYQQQISHNLPLGFKAIIPVLKGWDTNNKNQYLLLFLVILIVYFICSILLESIVQPLIIIAMIPASFIGIFITFYLFQLKVGQGGYASFLLVSGLVVNSALYIINDLNNYDQTMQKTVRMKRFIKAFNFKIIPVLLTILSTILGLVPFLFFDNKDGFWFSLAVGTIAGLLVSIVALVIFLPLMLKNITPLKIQSNG